eukprot:CAMPEP_0172504812 /NCGR_PEP_ID=MMETSP1066-20121228/181550_1 /TAXON_ID=671091 /ORGANISM="Coscinodiscus wailesii, Strain CCMP2513" /LENGTH=46 /DNA_ID= /DNA_START= /DNA_END= /DNA_ORIENTATION=
MTGCWFKSNTLSSKRNLEDELWSDDASETKQGSQLSPLKLGMSEVV